MVIQKEDLGLSLSLSFPENPNNIKASNCTNSLKKMPSLASSLPSTSPFNLFHKASWPEAFFFSDRNSDSCRVEEQQPFFKGIDVNRLPSTVDAEEEGCVSSPNSTISSLSGKRSERDLPNNGEYNETERASSRGMSDEEDGDTSRKKLRLSKDQSLVLEQSFKEHNTLNPKQKLALARRLGLRPRQVEVWFQNRRARTKLKQTEVDCEYLKICCENLTEENKRLQKEVEELRALKLSPKLYMHMTPPTTLNMCHSCQRVVAPSPLPTIATPSSTTSPVDRRARQMAPLPMPFNPWVVAPPMSYRAFDALHTRS